MNGIRVGMIKRGGNKGAPLVTWNIFLAWLGNQPELESKHDNKRDKDFL